MFLPSDFTQKDRVYRFAALEFQQSDKAVDYHYRVAPTFQVKVKKLSKKEQKKLDRSDWGFALFERHREEFEQLITEFINKIASEGYRYNSSTEVSVSVQAGCLNSLLGKQIGDLDFEAYEFIKTPEPINYLCKIFPRFKSKGATFQLDEMAKDLAQRVDEVIKQGYQLTGKVIFGAFMQTGCLGRGETINVDAFIFQKV